LQTFIIWLLEMLYNVYTLLFKLVLCYHTVYAVLGNYCLIS